MCVELSPHDFIRHTLIPFVKLCHPHLFDLFKYIIGPLNSTNVKLGYSDLLVLIIKSYDCHTFKVTMNVRIVAKIMSGKMYIHLRVGFTTMYFLSCHVMSY